MNLRAKIDPSIAQEIHALWLKRCEKVRLRKEYEKDIASDNELMTIKLNDLLKTTVRKMGGFSLEIFDSRIEVSQPFYVTRSSTAPAAAKDTGFCLTARIDSLGSYMINKSTIGLLPKTIEKTLRVFKKLRVERKLNHHTISMMAPPQVNILYSTSTKYSY